MEFKDLPLSHQLQIIEQMDTKSKLQLARVSRHFQDMIFGSQAPVSWSEVEVRVTSGERTLPFLAKVSPYARTMVAYVGSDVFGREGSLPEFPALTNLDIRATTPATRPSMDGLLTAALMSAFPSLHNLRLNGQMTQRIVRGFPSMFPAGLTSLTIGSGETEIGSETINGILSSFPALAHFTLEGTWVVDEDEPPGIYETVLHGLDRLQKANVYRLKFLDVDAGLIDKLAESSIAQGVRTLKGAVRRGIANFAPAVSPLSFSSLSTLDLFWNYNAFISMSNWLAAMRGLDTLETLIFRGHCTSRGPACLWDVPSGECLPRRLSTFALRPFSAVVNRNVMRAIVRRASTLKTVAIHKYYYSLNLVGIVDLITGLCHQTSQIEFLSVFASSLEVGVISEDQVRRLCSHLMAHAQQLSHLKLLHVEIKDPPRLVLNQEGCSVAALKQRLPRPECLVKFDDGSPGYTPEFSEAEKAFVRGLDGYTKTELPRRADD